MKTGGSGGSATAMTGFSTSTSVSTNDTTGGNISPNSAMMRTPGQPPLPAMMPATGWNSMMHRANNNFQGPTWTNSSILPSTMVAQPINTMKMSPMMPMLNNQTGQPMVLQPNTFAVSNDNILGF